VNRGVIYLVKQAVDKVHFQLIRVNKFGTNQIHNNQEVVAGD